MAPCFHAKEEHSSDNRERGEEGEQEYRSYGWLFLKPRSPVLPSGNWELKEGAHVFLSSFYNHIDVILKQF